MSLPLYYEIGRAAAFSAADAHEGQPEVDIRSIPIMVAAYNVVIEMDHDNPPEQRSYAGCPDWLEPTAAANWQQYAEGYGDALKELAAGPEAHCVCGWSSRFHSRPGEPCPSCGQTVRS